MTNIDYPAGPGFESEVPIKLPNRMDAGWGSDLICELFNKLGHDYVFLTPGSSFRGIHDSLVNYTRNHKPEIILCAHEEIAAAMAHGYAKANGAKRPALVILHNLVGVQHALMAFYNAWADRQPLLVLGGSGPSDPKYKRRVDWAHSANTQCELMREYTKWTDEPPTLEAALESITRAQRIAMSGPKAPTYVSIDTVIQESALDGPVEMPDVTQPRYRPAPPIAAAQDAVEAAADLLTEADWPVIVGGRIGLLAEATRPVKEVVEITGSAYRDDRDFVCLATAHPQNMTGGFGATAETEMLARADVVMGLDAIDLNNSLGMYGTQRLHLANTDVGGAGEEKPKKVIDLSLNDLTINHWSNYAGGTAPLDVQLLADPIHGLNQLLGEIRRRAEGNPPWTARAAERAAEVASLHGALRARQAEAVREQWDLRPIGVARMMHEVWQAVKDRDWYLPLRNGRSWYEGIWQFAGCGQYLSNNAGGGVGFGPGGVIGAALAVRGQGKLPVAIMGDGDFTMGPGAIWTAAHYKIPILIVLHNNTSFGNDEEHQIALAHQRERPVENAWIGQRMAGPRPDYATIARGYGGWGAGPVEDPDAVAAAMKSAVDVVARGGVALVDVHTQLN